MRKPRADEAMSSRRTGGRTFGVMAEKVARSARRRILGDAIMTLR
jgi:hypothetical protein